MLGLTAAGVDWVEAGVVTVSCAFAARSLRRASRARFAARSAASDDVSGTTLSLAAGATGVSLAVKGCGAGWEFCAATVRASFASLAALLRAYHPHGTAITPTIKATAATTAINFHDPKRPPVSV